MGPRRDPARGVPGRGAHCVGGDKGAAIAERLAAVFDRVDEEALAGSGWAIAGPFQKHGVPVTAFFVPGARRFKFVGLSEEAADAIRGLVQSHLEHELPRRFSEDSRYMRYTDDKVSKT